MTIDHEIDTMLACKRGFPDCRGPLAVRYACEVPNRLYDAIPCGIVHYTADLPHRLVFVNKLGCSILGFRNFEELQAARRDEAFSHLLDGDVPEVERATRRLADQELPIYEFHHRFVRGDGTIGWIRGKATLVERGEHPVVQAAFRDVSHDHAAQYERDRDRYTAVLCTAFAEVYEISTATDTCRLLNSIVEGRMPRAPEPINVTLSRWTALMVDPDDPDRVMDAVSRHLHNEDTAPLSLSYRVALGTRTVWIQSTFLRIDETGFLCCNEDVTDRMRHENEAISRGVADVVERLPIGIGVYRVNEQGIFPLYVSDPVCEMFGYTRREYDKRIEQGQVTFVEQDILSLLRAEDPETLRTRGFTADFPVRRKDGRLIQVRMRATLARAQSGEIALYAALLDITDEVRERRAQVWQSERFRILSELTHAISFDYDSETDTVLLYLDEGDGMKAHVVHNYLAELETKREGVIHPDSIGPVRALFKRVQQGQQHEVLDFRADYYHTGFRWHRANLYVVDDGGGSWHLIGLIEDTQDEHDLRHQAESDELTGISNHAATKRLIEAALADPAQRQRSICVLFDVDNFKEVNDRCGHLKGDELLSDIGKLLRNACRASDVVGRIGGDEFALLFKGMSLSAALCRLEALREEVMQLALLAPNAHVSVSIGVYEVQPDDVTYDGVVAKTDEALYRSKRAGKNRITVYE